MTNFVFAVSSVEKSPTGHSNCPINLSHCTYLHKEYFLSAGEPLYSIRFQGCVNSHNKAHRWGYSTEQERDADYYRILMVKS